MNENLLADNWKWTTKIKSWVFLNSSFWIVSGHIFITVFSPHFLYYTEY